MQRLNFKDSGDSAVGAVGAVHFHCGRFLLV
jgi:hypothetical protein